jgi:hypothetical protein
MPFRSEFTVALVRVRQARDRHGDLTGPVDELTFRAAVVPTSSAENLDGSGSGSRASTSSGDQVVTRQSIYPIADDVDVVATDRLRQPGEAGAPWQVIGDPSRYVSPYTGRKVMELTVERVSG